MGIVSDLVNKFDLDPDDAKICVELADIVRDHPAKMGLSTNEYIQKIFRREYQDAVRYALTHNSVISESQRAMFDSVLRESSSQDRERFAAQVLKRLEREESVSIKQLDNPYDMYRLELMGDNAVTWINEYSYDPDYDGDSEGKWVGRATLTDIVDTLADLSDDDKQEWVFA
jgi:hypothetical protein